ncbi:HAD family hydrolase [Pseudoduganella umbonata]|uniref:HAD family hydrolase n=1 Tax=Pseudoduganella umbonata TaxID=864828 RepID=A0A4P8HXQ2_9BURK|nr:HAD family hydrolase [Pseudoduganella umbonata]MBB3224472.1 HAD superfamily hydrolase (TIGR01549 family) [Pseudoduganella umbonata]QCP13245.1 HAD family hydrolase [Pseudoduganella umbonata]
MASELNHIKAVVCDVYGTLAEIPNRSAPFRQLLRYAREQGCVHDQAATMIMTHPGSVREHATRLGICLPESVLTRLETALSIELASVAVYRDVNPTFSELRKHGYAIGLCSNLAEPYAKPITEQIDIPLQCIAWSFEVGAIKPDPAIYAWVAEQLACPLGEIIFVGDSQAADVSGPVEAGMKARRIQRQQGQCLADVLAGLL